MQIYVLTLLGGHRSTSWLPTMSHAQLVSAGCFCSFNVFAAGGFDWPVLGNLLSTHLLFKGSRNHKDYNFLLLVSRHFVWFSSYIRMEQWPVWLQMRPKGDRWLWLFAVCLRGDSFSVNNSYYCSLFSYLLCDLETGKCSSVNENRKINLNVSLYLVEEASRDGGQL